MSFNFTTSREEWREKELKKSQARLTELLLNPASPITVDQEQKWSLVFRELEKLEELVTTDISLANIKATDIDLTIAAISHKIEQLFHDINPEKAEDDHALMLVSWELGMRISTTIIERKK